MAVEQTVKISVGEDRTLAFTIRDSAGTIVNITGWALEWVLRSTPYAATALITKATGAGIAITDGPGGKCEVVLARADTLLLPAGALFHALRRKDAGSSFALAYGNAIVSRIATR